MNPFHSLYKYIIQDPLSIIIITPELFVSNYDVVCE